MSSKNPDATETEPPSGEFKDLLAQAQALAKRVENLPDGPTKEKLRATLSELWVNVTEGRSEGGHDA
jgi:hypothetical protein